MPLRRVVPRSSGRHPVSCRVCRGRRAGYPGGFQALTPWIPLLVTSDSIETWVAYFRGTGSRGTNPLSVATGDTHFAYVYLYPANPPSEVMLQWNASGQWLRLAVPASVVGLKG